MRDARFRAIVLAAGGCFLLVCCRGPWARAAPISSYPIAQQPGIWPPETPQVNEYTPPPGYPLATEYFYALQDINNPAPATVDLDWMQVHAIVNGKDTIIVSNDYGSGAGQQSHISGDFTLRSDMVTEVPGNIASGWTTNAVVMTPSANPSVAYSAWNDVPGLVPAGATDVYVEARLLVTGSAVAQIGLDYWNSSLTANVNGAFGGFRIFASPDWQTVTLGFRPAIPGDVNSDGVVNGLDIGVVASHWLQLGTSPPGDANGDGLVNGLDINTIGLNWLQTSAAAVSVPEPSALLLASLACLAWLTGRRWLARGQCA